MIVEGNQNPGVACGNAWQPDANPGGWIVGWSECLRPIPLLWMPDDQLAGGVCIKWFQHLAGDPNGKNKPISAGRSISILTSTDSELLLRFWRPGDDDRLTVRLTEPGDFAAWADGLVHEWEVPKDSTVITIRWRPVA